jgi:putative FmdB family regulatory protein
VPIYEFECPACGTRFEELVGFDVTPPCPACGAPDPRRLVSQVFPTNKFLSAGDARRKTAQRLGERERKREQRS